MVGQLRKFAVTVAVSTLVFTTVATPAVAIPLDGPDVKNSDVQETGVSSQSGENNSTSHHVDPTNTSEEGDLLQVRGWLTRRLATQLGESGVKINQREYEAGRELLGDRYDSRLGQLVDVVGDTETERDDGFGDAFTDVQQTQRNYSETAQEYEKTYEAYQEAVQNGNETEARRQARRLQELEDRTQRLNETLVDQYNGLENQTGANFTEAVTAITSHSENISTQQSQIEEELFTETTLGITTDSEPISYENPLVVRGQLRTEDGEPLSNREILLQIYTRTRQVKTDANGRFTLRYRPRTIPVNTSTLTIRYVPQNESVYLGSNATLPVEIEPVEANLTVQSVSSSTSFGDHFEVTPVLTLDGEPVTGVPVEASIRNYQLAQRRTNQRGTATVESTIPASLVPGQQQVLVSLAHGDRAVRATSTTSETTIRSTETTVTVRGERDGENSIRISGRLQTENGRPVPAQPVQIELNESIERAVETDSNGTYSLVLDRSELPADAQTSVDLTVTFDGQGTNLNSTALAKQIKFAPFEQRQSGNSATNPAGGNNGASSEGQDGANRWVLLGGLGIIVVFLGGVIVAFRRYYNSQIESPMEDDQSPQTSVEAVATDESLDRTSLKSLLAGEQPEVAIQYAYHHVRDSLASSIDVQESDTHWEFFNKCREADLDRERLTALQDLIEMYEQAQFYEKREFDGDLGALLDDLETN